MSMIRYMEGAPGAYDSIYRGEGARRVGHPDMMMWCLYKDILKSLTEISLTSTKADERTESSGLLKVIQTFEFIMLVVIQDKLLFRDHGAT